MMEGLKEIVLKVADSLRNKVDGISHMQSNQGLARFAEALISAYKAELLKEVWEPVAYSIFICGEPCDVYLNKDDAESEYTRRNERYPDKTRSLQYLFTSDQVAAAVAKATKPLEEEIERLNRKISAYKSRIFTNTNREMVLRNRFFTAHEDAFVCDNNFDFDAGLQVSGDFIGDEKQRYAQMIASTLNDYQALEDQLATAEQRVAEACADLASRWGESHGCGVTVNASNASRKMAEAIRSGAWKEFKK